MGVLDRLFASKTERERIAREEAIADPIIDRLVAKTEKRLAMIPNYRKALRGPVIAARERLGGIVQRIPGPTEVSPASWSKDETLRPLFANGDDAAAAFSEDDGVRMFLAMNPATDCYGMLALLQTERTVLATVQQGDLQTEVQRKTVSFGEPQVLAPGKDEAEVRNELVMRALEYLALRAMEAVGGMRLERRELEAEQALLRAQIALAQRRGAGFGAIASGDATQVADRGRLERELQETVAKLEQSASKNLLPALMDELLAAFEHPERHLTVEPCALSLDPMNFSIPPGSPQAVTPCAAILNLARRGPFAVLVARFPHGALRAPQNRLAEAAKYL
jgi:hypothetical protein